MGWGCNPNGQACQIRSDLRSRGGSPNSPLRNGLLDFALFDPAASGGTEPCSAARKAASAVSTPPSSHAQRWLCLPTALVQRAAKRATRIGPRVLALEAPTRSALWGAARADSSPNATAPPMHPCSYRPSRALPEYSRHAPASVSHLRSHGAVVLEEGAALLLAVIDSHKYA